MTGFPGFDPPAGPPAGWYPDPYGGHGQRYWDGRAWDLEMPVGGYRSDDHQAYDRHVRDQLPTVGDWLDRAFRTAIRRWRATAVIALLTSSVSTALTYTATNRALEGLVIEGDEVFGWTNDRLPATIVLGLLAILIGAVGSLAVSVLMLRSVDGERAGSGAAAEVGAGLRALRDAIAVLPRAIGWALVLGAGGVAALMVIAVLAVAIGPLVLLFLLVVLPLIIWLAVKWAFIAVAIVDRPGNPFSRSGRVSDGRWWRTLGRLLLITIIVWLISAGIQSFASALSGGGLGGLNGTTTITIGENGEIERFALGEELHFDTLEIVVLSAAAIISTVLASGVMAAATSVLYRTRNPRP